MERFKERIITQYITAVSDKIAALQRQQDDLLESLRHETKSTAGDKYETSRAMLHLEQEGIASQLSVLLQHKAVLEHIARSKNIPAGGIQYGSLVRTDKGLFLIAAALGKRSFEGQVIFAISPESPLGKSMLGKGIGDTIQVQSASYRIEAIS